MKTEGDIYDIMKDIFADTIQEMTEAELDTTLGYGKSENRPSPQETGTTATV